jgi:trehalose 6-phosphate synthase
VLTALPGHEKLVEALCAYDLIGFQTSNDLRAFTDYIVNEARRNRIRRRVRRLRRRGRAGAFPISIDTEGFARAAEHAAARPT